VSDGTRSWPESPASQLDLFPRSDLAKPCKHCGRPLRRDNTTGFCTRTAECKNAGRRIVRSNRRRTVNRCTHPGGCPNPICGNGLCEMHLRRLSRTGELGPAGTLRNPRLVHWGDTFGEWTALGSTVRTSERVLCRCTCGTEREVLAMALLGGRTRSCGCRGGKDGRRGPLPIKPKPPYLTAGAVLGWLTLLENAPYEASMVRCRCTCGTETTKLAGNLKTSNTKSCGCMQGVSFTRHGLSGHPLYQTWRGIINRTTKPSDPGWPSYGGRGITVCERWQELPDGLLNFISDIECILGPRPKGTSLDRTENDGNYEPGNIRWSPPDVQMRNRRSVRGLTKQRDELARRVAELEAEREALLAAMGTTPSGNEERDAS